MTHFKTIWTDFCFVHPTDCFQDHLTQFYHCVPYWLISRPYEGEIFVIVYTMIKLGQLVLKGVNWVPNKLDQMVLKGVIWVHNY